MPNWPIIAAASLLASSAASLSRKASVPERAMVPRPLIKSSRVMPTPLSATVSVFLSGSRVTVMAKGPLSVSSGLAIAS